jgi:nucleotide-binding universal stress UspA family protein
MTRQNRIVVGIDGSNDGLRAAEYAAVEARLRGSDIQLVHAVNVHALVNPRVAEIAVEDFRVAGQQALDAAELRIAQIDPAIRVSADISNAPRARAVVDAAKKASLVVLARRPVSGLRRVLTGSTSTAVAAHAKTPVITVPSGWSRGQRQRRVVVGTDGSAEGQDALAFAFAEASRRTASLVAVRGWEVPLRWYGDLDPAATQEPDWSSLATLALSEDLAGWSERYPDVPVVRAVEQASAPAELLLDHVEDAAMLVVGARGDGGLLGLELGWTARSVIAHAPCPVAVVHRGDVLPIRAPRSTRAAHTRTPEAAL